MLRRGRRDRDRHTTRRVRERSPRAMITVACALLPHRLTSRRNIMQAKILAGCCILGLGIGATSVALGQKTEPAPSPAPAVIAPAVRLVQGTWSCGSPAVVTVNVHGGSAGVTGTVRISGGGVTAGTSQGFTIKAGAVSAVTVPT